MSISCTRRCSLFSVQVDTEPIHDAKLEKPQANVLVRVWLAKGPARFASWTGERWWTPTQQPLDVQRWQYLPKVEKAPYICYEVPASLRQCADNGTAPALSNL